MWSLRLSAIIVCLSLILPIGLSAAKKSNADQKSLSAEQIQDIELLERGGIPESLSEKLRLIPSTSEEGIQFQRVMLKFIKEIYPDRDFENEGFRFLLSDSPQINGIRVRHAVPPIVVLTKGFIESAQYESQILWLLGHEYTHQTYGEKFGDKNRSNTKGEEMSSDHFALNAVINAKQDPRPILSFLKTTLLKDTLFDIDTLVSPYLQDSNRLRLLQNHIAAEGYRTGDYQGYKSTELDLNFKKIVEGAHHISHLEEIQRTKNYAELDQIKKLELLKNYLISVKPWNSTRLTALIGELKKIKFSDHTSNLELKIRDEMADFIYDSIVGLDPKNIFKLYSANLLAAFPRKKGEEAVGRLDRLARAFVEFKNAQTYIEAVKAAENLQAVVRSFPKEVARMASDYSSLQFSAPREKQDIVAWDRFIFWGRKDETGVIHRALLLMGIKDSRMMRDLSLEVLNELNSHLESQILVPPTIRNAFPHQWMLDRSGRVVGVFKFDELGDTLESELLLKSAEHLFIKAVEGDAKSRDQLDKALRSMPDGFDFAKPMNLELLYRDPVFYLRINNKTIVKFIEYSRGGQHRVVDSEIEEVAEDISLEESAENFLVKLSYAIEKVFENATSDQKKDLRDFIVNSKNLFLNYDTGVLGSLRNSYLIAEKTDGILTDEERIKFLSRLTETDPDLIFGDRSELSLVAGNAAIYRIRKVLNYSPPMNLKDLIVLTNKFSGKKDSIYNRAITVETLVMIDKSRLGAKLKNSGRLLIDKKFDLIQLLEALLPFKKLKQARQLSVFESKVKSHKWPTTTSDLIKHFLLVDQFGLFASSLDLRQKILTRIIDKLMAEPSDQIEILAERLLAGAWIESPKTRDRVINIYTENALKIYGKDKDRSKAEQRQYNERVLETVRRLKKLLSLGELVPVVAELTKKLETQPELSNLIKSEFSQISAADLEGSQKKMIAAESILLAVSLNESVKDRVVDFLSSPKETDKTHELAQEIRAVLDSNWGNSGLGLFAKIESPEQIKVNLDSLWDNFWAAPMPVRAIFLEGLLFPNRSEEAQEITRAYNYVVDKLFPIDEKYSDLAREILTHYFTSIPFYQKKLFLAALMVAKEKSRATQKGERPELGERLALILESMGPAETKLGQAIHSHPDTPEEIRRGTGRLKSKADAGYWWDICEIYSQQVPSEVRAQIKHLKSVLGSASVWVAVEVELIDGSLAVLALMRPNALERGSQGFKMMESTERLMNQEKKGYLGELIHSARQLFQSETDHIVSEKQFKTSLEIFDQRTVVVDGVEIRFQVAKNIVAGPGYRLMQKAPGLHFNDLGDASPEEKILRERIATANLVVVLDQILQGGAFDFDRHGEQVKVEGNLVTVFDFGGILLNPPSVRQKKLLGHVLVDGIISLLDGKDMDTILFEFLKRNKLAREDLNFILIVQRALLAVQDFRKHVSNQRLISALKAIYDAGIDSEITHGIVERAMASGRAIELLGKLNGEVASGSQNCIQVIRKINP